MQNFMVEAALARLEKEGIDLGRSDSFTVVNQHVQQRCWWFSIRKSYTGHI
jgi:hypothetical protein